MPQDIYVDDVIGKDVWGDGVTRDAIRAQLEDVPDGERVRLRINSEGGSVFEATAIVSELKRRGGYDVLVDGLAASAASYIAVSGDRVEMADGSWLMVHNPHAMIAGDYRDMQKTASDLLRFADRYATHYAERTGIDEDVIRAMMDAETWISDEEAVTTGWADAIADVGAQGREVAACFRQGPLAYRQIKTPRQRLSDADKARLEIAKIDASLSAGKIGG